MRFTALLACAAVLAAADAVVPADRSQFHIVVLMGQSNMAGTATPILPEYATPAERVLTLEGTTWRPATSPLERGRGPGMCPGQSFAKHYADLHPGVTVGLVQCARGGRSIKELGKGGTDRDGSLNYDQNLARIRVAMQAGTLKAVLWHQGESDAGDQGYVDRLAAYVADLRGDLGTPEVPFIAGEIGRFLSWGTGFNNRLQRAPATIPRSAVVSAEGLGHLGDVVHFSGFSAEIQGARYLDAWLAIAEPQLRPRFGPVLQRVTREMQARDAAWDVLLNGDASEGGERPFAWDGRWTGRGNLAFTRDTAESVSPPASLRLAAVGGSALGSVSQSLREVAGRSLRITAQARNAGFASVRMTITGIDGSWKQVFDRSLFDAAKASAWTAFTAEVAVPANAVNCRLSLVADGDGQAWFDDIVVERIASPARAELLANPGMEDGDAVPSGWTATWAGKGKVAAARDTVVRHGGAAALRVSSDGGPASGNVSQPLQGMAGKTLTVSGWLRSEGAGASLGLGAFDETWKMLAWEPIGAVGPGAEWTRVEKTFAIPAGAAHVNLGACIDGDGKAWFDDLSASAP